MRIPAMFHPTPASAAPEFVREGLVTFTPEHARHVVEAMRYELQRDETKARNHIAALAEMMKRDQWLGKSQIDFARMPDGRLILINGHHRMRAQILANRSILWSVAFHDCGDASEVRSLYYRFDTTVRKRTAHNVIAGANLGADLNLSAETTRALWSAAPYLAHGFSIPFRNDRVFLTDDRIATCREFVEEAQFFDHCLRAMPTTMKRHARTVSVFAVAMATLKHAPDQALEFWTGVAEDDGLKKGDPRKTLIIDMMNRSSRSGMLAAKMFATAKAWNAYHRGRLLKIIKVDAREVKVDGTPYTVSA